MLSAVRRAFIEVHAAGGVEVEVSVNRARHGWYARLRVASSAVNGFDDFYSTWKAAEQDVHRIFRVLFPCHKCSERCRRFGAEDSRPG